MGKLKFGCSRKPEIPESVRRQVAEAVRLGPPKGEALPPSNETTAEPIALWRREACAAQDNSPGQRPAGEPRSKRECRMFTVTIRISHSKRQKTPVERFMELAQRVVNRTGKPLMLPGGTVLTPKGQPPVVKPDGETPS